MLARRESAGADRADVERRLRDSMRTLWCLGAVATALAAFALVPVTIAVCSRVEGALAAGAPDLWHALYTADPSPALPVPPSGGLYSAVHNGGGWAAVTTLASGLPALAIGVAACLGVTLMLRDVARTGRPFSDRVVRSLRRVSVLLVAADVVPALLCMLASWAAPAGASFSLSGGTGWPILAGAALAAVSRVFEYGCVLQRQDDETL